MHLDQPRYLCLIIFTALLLVFPAGAANAQTPETEAAAENTPLVPLPEETTSSGSLIVTSVESCLKKLSPASAEEVRLHFEKPYQECQQRLRQQEQKQRREKPGENGEPPGQDAPVAEGPRNFLRVQNKARETGFSPQKQQNGKAADSPAQETTDAAPPSPAPSVPTRNKPALNSSTYNH